MSHNATGTQDPQSYPATFGSRLRQRRKEQSISPDQFADLAGCSAITLLKIEAGERRPSRQLAQLLAERLHIPPDEAGGIYSIRPHGPCSLNWTR